MSLSTLRLRSHRDRPARAGHPWLFSGAFEAMPQVAPGSLCRVEDSQGGFVAWGYVNPTCSLAVRVLAWEEVADVDVLLQQRIRQAVQLRRGLFDAATNAYRVIAGEGDFLPGLIVDQYADTLVVQVTTAGMEQLRERFLPILVQELSPKTIFERNDLPSRREEGLPMRKGVVWGKDSVGEIEILENGLRYYVNPDTGQKTGFYIDQRENRRRVRSRSRGRRVLNCFAYTGGFSVAAYAGGAAEVVHVESSSTAVALCQRNLQLNGFATEPLETFDVFKFLRAANREEERFDLIVLDPPAFAKKRHQVDSARRGYKEINLQAIRLLNPGGELFTFSCSQYLDPEVFRKLVFEAAANAKARMQLLSQLGHAPDHPTSVSHLEGEYLKGVHLRRI